MKSKKSKEDILKKFGIKPCSINLEKSDFSKIKMTCSAESTEENIKLFCDINQTDSNTFSIKIKRKIIDKESDGGSSNLKKRFKISASPTVQHLNDKNISRMY